MTSAQQRDCKTDLAVGTAVSGFDKQLDLETVPRMANLSKTAQGSTELSGQKTVRLRMSRLSKSQVIVCL